MLKILRYVLSLITLLFASYGVITRDFKFGDSMILFLGLTMLVLGLEEFKKERKVMGGFLLVVCLFSLYVSIEGFLLN
ncbi:YczI family protein [Mesobacillus maritimus]|uniref:YczI family protein n=2 Tax=Mesobacillus maritimus TaxID=1643336 RepID=A0ABS7K7A8_9BACI|nr:YczI family protein [Mesobacillus maritimus]